VSVFFTALYGGKDQLPDNAGRGGIRHPGQLRAHLARYVRAGIDQVMFVQQSGDNRHEHICESLEVFAERVMPEFKLRDEVLEARKAPRARALYRGRTGPQAENSVDRRH